MNLALFVSLPQTSPALCNCPCHGTTRRDAPNGTFHAATSNGYSPRQDSAAARLSDALPRLGRLAAEGYAYEPAATQLEAMYRSDPDSLKQVGGLTACSAHCDG